MRSFLIILFLGISTSGASQLKQVDISFSEQNESTEYSKLLFSKDSLDSYRPKYRKAKAVLLAVFLGHFGVHRIYLGSAPNVPLVYSLTLGGGFGLLPLLDIVAILSTKDLDQYTNNDKVFMWSKSK